MKNNDLLQKIRHVGQAEYQRYLEIRDPNNPYGPGLDLLARRNFKRLATVMYVLLHQQQRQFDVIIAAGDSGYGIAELTRQIYFNLGMAAPQLIAMPVIRYQKTWLHYTNQPVEPFDNSALIPDMILAIQDLESAERVLFVDDEVAHGLTLRHSLQLLSRSIQNSNIPTPKRVTVVAEDQGYQPQSIRGIDPEFIPFATETEGVSNLISYMVPWSIHKHIKTEYGDIDSKELLNALLGIPTKAKAFHDDYYTPKPVWTDEVEKKLCQQINQFDQLQQEFKALVHQWIEEAIQEYANTHEL